MPGLPEGPIQRRDDLLAVIQAGYAGEVFGNGFTGHRQAVTVEEAVVQQVFHDRRYAADVVQVLHDILAAGFEIGETRGPIADALEVFQGQGHADRARHRNQVNHGVGGTAENDDQHHGVFERLARHDVAGPDVLFQQVPDGLARLQAFLLLGRVHGRCG